MGGTKKAFTTWGQARGMNRRGFLVSLTVATLSGSGCIQMDTQPSEVPIWIENRTSQHRNVGVECRKQDSSDSLVSTELELSAGEEESVYAEPIETDIKYVVSLKVDGRTVEESFLADGVRDIDVEIRATDDVRFETIST